MDADGRQTTLLFAAGSGRLHAYQTLATHPLEGDVVDTTELLDYRDFGGVTWWEAVVAGETTRVNLPDWPAASEVGLFPSGTMLAIFRGLDVDTFDFGDFDEADLASAYSGRFSLSVFVISNP